MAAKWQKWMPLYLNELRGSMFFRALPDAAKVGYLFLLMAQWESEDGALSADPAELAMYSGLGERWAEFGALLLRKFDEAPGGRLRNVFLFSKWQESRTVYEKRRSGGGKHADCGAQSGAQSATTPPQTPSGLCDTGTYTETVVQKQKPSRAKTASGDGLKHSADPRHIAFKEAIGEYWKSKNPGIDMPWGGHEGKELGMWLREAPHITIEQFKGFLRGRFRSDVNHGERPSQWLRWITSYGQPVDRFGKPQENGANGKTGTGNSAPSVTKQRVDRNLAAIDKALERRGLSATDFDRQADGAELPGTGLERVLGGLPVGLRAVMPAVQHDPRDVGASRVENPAGPEILPPAA